MFLETVVVGDLDTNCYIIASEYANEAIVIDPAGNAGVILDTIAAKSLDVKYILLTHGHWDHFGVAGILAEKTGAKIGIHKDDLEMLGNPMLSMGFMAGEDENETIKADFELTDGQVLKIGDMDVKIIHTPGHTRGGVTIQIGDSLFTGDLIFYRSIGRTDLAGGSYESLLKSVREKIFTYPDQVKIYPGHGPSTSVGEERRGNPYFT
ncbi:MAG TPA: MBL fold metallo-hydrolase [Anaerolineae bacterium]|jgi:glyoxylase-like metal-dependent hydrolase (beta-lactamase superfamily II)|nr:MBL fold metallo-hydrolase [Anaerolineae bacterium]